eukprot:4110681-Amphidinium_carterae.1
MLEALPDSMKGKTLYPTLTYKNVTLQAPLWLCHAHPLPTPRDRSKFTVRYVLLASALVQALRRKTSFALSDSTDSDCLSVNMSTHQSTPNLKIWPVRSIPYAVLVFERFVDS